MCPSSNVRCGSCLSKWNGKSWEESYKCVLPIKSWSLVLNKKYQLCIEGLCDIDSDLTVCIPITDRLNSYWVSNNCTLVKLRGVLNTKELPEYVAAKFANGVPTNWKEIVNKWIEFVQRGEKSSFPWEQDESFDSCDTSFLLTRSRRVMSERKADGKPKGKSIQRTCGELSRSVEEERDSAVPASEDCSSKIPQPGSPPSIWHSVSPQLPAYKVKEIIQWMDIAHLSSEPFERETEVVGRDTNVEFVAPSKPVSNPKKKVQTAETVHRKTNNIPQSTPISGSAMMDSEGLPVWNVSSVHSTLNTSALESVASDVFGKSDSRNRSSKNLSKNISKTLPSQLLPIQENVQVSGSDSGSDQPLINLVSGSVFREPSQGQPPKAASKTLSGKIPRNSKNAEVPGSRMGRMLSSSLRPRRKQTLQKIERWRPVLGVDGCLKVQGYLLLQCDMTAGQILTTNTVVNWGARKVVTCDGREYELVGDPYGKIPDDLRNQLLKPMDCAEITTKLMEFQALKDRSDWGAEYELFYGNTDNENNDGDKTTNKSARTTKNMRNNRRTTPRISPVGRQKLKSSTVTVNMQDVSPCVTGTPTNSRLRGTVRKNIDSDSTSADLNSDSTTRTQKITHNTLELNSSANNRSSNKVDKNSSNFPNLVIIQERTSGPAAVNNNLVALSNNLQDKENNCIGRSRADATRSCFENITWKNTQNQMMMPSPRLRADSSNVDFSSSRIKVSYITSGTKSSPNNLQNSSESPSRSSKINESHSSNECTPKSRPSRVSSKRACLPCLQDSKSRTTSKSPLSQTRRQTIPEKTTTRATSPSPVRNETETSPPVVPQSDSKRKPSSRVKTPAARAAPHEVPRSNKAETVTRSARRKTPAKSFMRPPSPKSLRSTTRTTARQLRVLVRRFDTRKSFQNAKKLSPQRKSISSPRQRKSISSQPERNSPSSSQRMSISSQSERNSTSSSQRMSISSQQRNSTSSAQKKSASSQQQRKSVTKENKKASPKASKKNKKEKNVSAVKKIPNKKPVEATKKNNKDEEKNKRNENKKKEEEKITKMAEEQKNKSKKLPPTKTIPSGSGENNDDGNASDCSSDSSVGPSASIVFQMNNPPEPRRKPRTLKERRERDAQLAEMGRKLAAKEIIGIDDDDDPMANLIASHKFSPLPQEWCRHENLLGKSRKRRRPSSSDGTVSPSRSGLDDGFGNEDATSSVATPQLLMRPPDPKQVQSYLQRQRAWNAKPQRPTRPSRRGNDNLLLPHIDYAAVFRPEISDEESASEVSLVNSDWDA